jgi:hypothetical protein
MELPFCEDLANFGLLGCSKILASPRHGEFNPILASSGRGRLQLPKMVVKLQTNN